MRASAESRGRRPTLETVAALAGVSRATASRVVNQDPRVAPALRELVEEAVQRLGYVPNHAARSLATRRADAVALVMREPVEFGAVDPYLSSMVVATGQALARSRLQLVVMMSGEDDAGRVAGFVRSHVDGVLLLSVHDDDPLLADLSRAGVPTVVGGRPTRALPGIHYVDIDNAGGGRQAVRRLVGRGCHRLATITGPADMTPTEDRLAGWMAGMAEAGLATDLVASGDFTSRSGAVAMRELLERAPDLDGVFAANDMMAVGALTALREAGRHVPGQVAVVGFDDVELAEHTQPPLTTVRVPLREQAERMVELLVQRLRGSPPPQLTVLDTVLVPRASA